MRQKLDKHDPDIYKIVHYVLEKGPRNKEMLCGKTSLDSHEFHVSIERYIDGRRLGDLNHHGRGFEPCPICKRHEDLFLLRATELEE